jgi:hypothetical protein
MNLVIFIKYGSLLHGEKLQEMDDWMYQKSAMISAT